MACSLEIVNGQLLPPAPQLICFTFNRSRWFSVISVDTVGHRIRDFLMLADDLIDV
jgi:hypothetical protein